MGIKVYYNEFDPFAAQWLRKLIGQGELPKGVVDERPIEEVKAKDLEGYAQCHFFAGIGVWAYALARAEWGGRSVWTGSCPCQPFSVQGQYGGAFDKRHLWPTWYRLLGECRPHTVFGEQVAGKNGLAWFDAVSLDLERAGYAVGAACTSACSFGAPHHRHRLYFVASLGHSNGRRQVEQEKGSRRAAGDASQESERLADATLQRLEGAKLHAHDRVRKQSRKHRLGYAIGGNKKASAQRWDPQASWREFDRVQTRDGKAERPIEPGTYPLAYGTANDVGFTRCLGNSLCAPQAQGFVEAFMETRDDG